MKQLRRDPELNGRPTHLDPEVWELDEENEDRRIGRLDLRFLFSTGILKPWPCFAIEAKRLHVDLPSGWKSLVSEYVTSESSKPVEEEQGMMCFVSGRYSRGLSAGAMLGYVYDGDVTAARNAIASAIQTHATKLQLAPPGWMDDSTILSGAGICESQHYVADEVSREELFRARFTIYHLVVAV